MAATYKGNKMAKLGNLLTAMVTPFKKDGSVNYAMAEKLAQHLIHNGSEGLVIHGTTGESPTLTHEEEYELYRVIKKAVGSQAKVIAGTGSNSTATSIASTKKAEEIGVDAAMIVTPYYNKPSQEGLFQHFKAIAENTSLPLILYNIPGRCGVNVLPDTIARVAKIKNYVAVKEAAGSVEQAAEIRKKTPKEFDLYSGDDGLTLDFMKVGAIGIISVASHVVGLDIKDMIKAQLNGNGKKAEEINQKLADIFKTLFITTNPVPVKAALRLMGWEVGSVRLPLVDVTTEEENKIKKSLKSLNLI